MWILIFALISSSICLAEFLLWRTITPNLLAIFPTFLLVLYGYFLAPIFGFIEIYDGVLIILIMFFLVGFLASLCSRMVDGRLAFSPRSRVPAPLSKGKFQLTGLALLFMVILAALITYKIYGEVGNVYSDDFSDRMSNGLIGHLLVFLMVTSPIFLLVSKNKKLALFTFSLTILILLIRQVKGWVIIPLLNLIILSFYANLRKNTFASFAKPLLLILMSSLIFFLAYLLNFYSRGQVNIFDAMNELSIHFLAYSLAGILGFSQMLTATTDTYAQEPSILFSPIINIFSFIFSNEYLNPISADFFIINNQYSKFSNVYTLWGTLFRYAGNFSFFLYFVMMIVLYQLLILSRFFKIALLLYCYWASMLFLAWFEFYYWHLSVYEGAVYIVLFYLFLNIRLSWEVKKHA